MPRTLAAIIGALLLVTPLEGARQTPDRSVTIVGFVFAADTSLPIPDATVRLVGTSSRSTISDEAGRFEFRDVPPGRYVASAVIAGYASGTAGPPANITSMSGTRPDSRTLLAGEAAASGRS